MYISAKSILMKNLVPIRCWLIRKLVGKGLDWNIEASLSLDGIVRYCPKGEVLCSLGPVNRLFPENKEGDPVNDSTAKSRPIVIEWGLVPYDFSTLDFEKYLGAGVAIEAP